MRNSNKLLYIICILGLFTLCCSEDNNSLDTNNPQTVACLSVGYVWCNGLCINPLTSNQYCGINIYCENYKTCDKEETCQNGVCRSSSVNPITPDCPYGNCQEPDNPATTCALDEHKYYNGCEKDSVEHCGNHDISCAVEISGWADGNCIKGTCHVTACQNDMHPDENACVYDTVQDCGKKGFACADRVPGWKTGACSDGQCKVMQCIDGYHVDDKMSNCVMDTAQCCGTACTKCTNNQICSGSQCRGQCPANTKVCNGACIDVTSSIEHCGECNHNCNANKPAHAQTMRCSQSQCQISECETNYRLESQNGAQVCKADTINSCGSDGTKCSQYEWWGDGSCTNGICIPSACKGDYYLAKNNSGQNVCEPNDDNNCGGHGIKCTGGKCVEGRCLGDALCNGVTHNLLDDLDHCGKCNNRCKDGLVCDNGKCKVGNGNAYCNGNKVVTGTIDNCGGCADRCKDSLICKDNACVPGAGITYCSGVTKDSRADVDHCGACNHRCAEKLVCDNGVCKTGNGLMYCNGVKIDSTRDSEHCGGCNNPCTAGTACCTDKASCGEGYYDIGVNTPICFKSTGNVICSGKETNRDFDPANCGQCGKKCYSCSLGECSLECNGHIVNISTSLDNCGQCGIRCSDGKICTDGVCTIGIGDTYCNGEKVNTTSNPANCGQCGKKCDEGQICKSGSCQTGIGYTLCDGKTINTAYDSANCGMCGNVCNVGKRCNDGVCTAGTGATYCDGILINTSNDLFNCSKCANTCATHKICQNGTCSDPKVGDFISLGLQNQESLSWIILNKDEANHRVMIQSRYAKIERPYHTKCEAVTWAESTIRSWLNGYGKSENKQSQDYTSNNFMNAFTSEERARILSVQIVNANNPEYGTPGGVNTNDKVFLLSIDEVKTLLGTTKKDICSKIDCAIYYHNWWLRSPGKNAKTAAYVRYDGTLETDGDSVCNDNRYLRPAMWINY